MTAPEPRFIDGSDFIDNLPEPREDVAVAEVESVWREIDRNTPEAFWDVAVWIDDNWVVGSLDVANRKAIGLHILRADRRAEQ